jgi:hypothetical protein
MAYKLALFDIFLLLISKDFDIFLVLIGKLLLKNCGQPGKTPNVSFLSLRACAEVNYFTYYFYYR